MYGTAQAFNQFGEPEFGFAVALLSLPSVLLFFAD